MRAEALAALGAAVQTNCDIADARHAADLPLCLYLLQMRELYRWERRLPFTADLDRGAVGTWLGAREAKWSHLADRPWQALPIDDRQHDPLDVEGINTALAPHGLVYGAGLIATDRPTFFLAALDAQAPREDGLRLLVCGREEARGLFAPPALLAAERTIVLRRESLARWLWEKFEAFSLRRADGPMKALLEGYGLRERADFVDALPRLVEELGEVLVLHEVGEYRAGQWLGPAWAAMRLTLDDRRTDLRVRAVRDHLADLEVTLPALLQQGHTAALHFWFANFEGWREQLYPSLTEAYDAWRRGDAGRALLQACAEGVQHFRVLAAEVLALHERLGPRAATEIDRVLSAPRAVLAVAA